MSVLLDESCLSVQINCLFVQEVGLKLDPITDVFKATHVASVVHARLEATAPWGLMCVAEVAKDAVSYSTASENLRPQFAHFGMILRGNCWLSVAGISNPLPLTGGDCFLLAPGSTYTLRDNPRTRARSFCEVAPRDGSRVIHYGGGGALTTIVSGWFQFDQTSVRMLNRLLPPVILVQSDQAQSLTLQRTLTTTRNDSVVLNSVFSWTGDHGHHIHTADGNTKGKDNGRPTHFSGTTPPRLAAAHRIY